MTGQDRQDGGRAAGSTIGAGVFLYRSVPANSLVVDEEARIIVLQKRSDLAGYQT